MELRENQNREKTNKQKTHKISKKSSKKTHTFQFQNLLKKLQ